MTVSIFLPLNWSFEFNLDKLFCWLYQFSVRYYPDLVRMAGKLVALGNQAVKAAIPHLKTFWYYGKVELVPPKFSEIPAIVSGFGRMVNSFKSGSWKQLTIKQAFLNTLVAAEVTCWFYVGECIGKRRIIGYKMIPLFPH